MYAIDVEDGEQISTEHPAVLFNDRVTQPEFHRGGKNCSYFAVAPLELSQQRLTAILAELRARTLEEAAASGAPLPQRPWQTPKNSSADERESPPAAAADADVPPAEDEAG